VTARERRKTPGEREEANSSKVLGRPPTAMAARLLRRTLRATEVSRSLKHLPPLLRPTHPPSLLALFWFFIFSEEGRGGILPAGAALLATASAPPDASYSSSEWLVLGMRRLAELDEQKLRYSVLW